MLRSTVGTYRWQWWFPSTPEQLWPEISDTDRFNKRAGLPPVRYEYEPLSTGVSRTTATIKLGPITVRWLEPPWDWSENEYYRVVRQYCGGPLKTIATATRLIPERGGTRIEMVVDLIPRDPIGVLLVPLIAVFGYTGASRAFNAAASAVKGQELQAISAPREATGEQSSERRVVGLEYAQELLEKKGFDPKLVYRLVSHLATADDRDLARMRAFELADAWKVERNTVLRLFLTATRSGLLNLSWDVLCPRCRGPQATVNSLSELKNEVHCDACNVSFGSQFDRSVEVTFDAVPLGKGVDVPIFCRAGPHNTPHVLAQKTLAPQDRAEMHLPLEKGHYAAEVVGMTSVPFEWTAGNTTPHLSARITNTTIEGVPAMMHGSALQLNVESLSSRDISFRLVKTAWPDTITTAAQVTALQDFRDLFSSEVLETGLELGIQSLTVLFTDLVGSTELYSRAGDAPAFRIVHDHFEQMREVIASKNGGIVKTIGDAVMAVFVNPADALEAAIRLPSAVGEVRIADGPLMLRVGFHTGPCIAMTANDKLDYFGTTVNLAARIQHVANGGEVVMSAVSAELPAVAAKLHALPTPPKAESLKFKGFTREVPVVRVMALS